jgi:hypothetical protein
MRKIRTFARMRRALLLVGAAFAALPVGSALADTTLGSVGGGNFACASDVWVDSAYVVPSGSGAITSFSFNSDWQNTGQQLDFLALRPVAGGYTVVGETGLITLAGTGVETFAASIPVQVGDVLGFWLTNGFVNCAHPAGQGPASVQRVSAGTDPSIGQTLVPAVIVVIAGIDLNESANLRALPVATTAPATGIGDAGASLNGTVNPSRQPTTYHFEYGITTAYGSRVPGFDAGVGAGSADQPVSAPVYGLAPGRTYHFRIVATNSSGTSYGNDQAFTTQGRAPTITTNAAGPVSASGATLNGTVNPQGRATMYRFEYGVSTAYGSRVPGDDAPVGSDSADHPVSQPISGLLPSITYHYRLVAINATGTSYGMDRTFTTLPLPSRVASVPGKVGTLGAKLNFTFVCQGSAGQTCHGQVTAMAIEKLSSNGKAITGVRSLNLRSGRYLVVTILKGNLSAAAGHRNDVSIGLNSTGQMLRNKFKTIPSDITITANAVGKTITIRTVNVTFGFDPPKTSLAVTPTTKGTTFRFQLRCEGQSGQVCQGSAKITTYERLAVDGKTITGLSSGPSGNGGLVTLANIGWRVRTGAAITVIAQINAAGQNLVKKFGKVPATLTITPTYNGYTLNPISAKTTFKR